MGTLIDQLLDAAQQQLLADGYSERDTVSRLARYANKLRKLSKERLVREWVATHPGKYAYAKVALSKRRERGRPAGTAKRHTDFVAARGLKCTIVEKCASPYDRYEDDCDTVATINQLDLEGIASLLISEAVKLDVECDTYAGTVIRRRMYSEEALRRSLHAVNWSKHQPRGQWWWRLRDATELAKFNDVHPVQGEMYVSFGHWSVHTPAGAPVRTLCLRPFDDLSTTNTNDPELAVRQGQFGWLPMVVRVARRHACDEEYMMFVREHLYRVCDCIDDALIMHRMRLEPTLRGGVSSAADDVLSYVVRLLHEIIMYMYHVMYEHCLTFGESNVQIRGKTFPFI